jgi:hypothetical protein
MSRTMLALSAIAGLVLGAALIGGQSAEAHPRHLHFFGGKSLEYYGSHGHYRVCRNRIVEYIPYRWHHKKGYWPVYGKQCCWVQTR